MSQGYRVLLALNEHEDAVKVTEVQGRAWLRTLQRNQAQAVRKPDWNGPGIHRVGPNAILSVAEHRSPSEFQANTVTGLSLDLVLSTNDGVWNTRILAVSAPEIPGQYVLIEGHGRHRDGSAVEGATPRIVRDILYDHEASDGAVPVLSEPHISDLAATEELRDHIENQARRICIIIAVPGSGTSVEDYARTITPLMDRCRGVASVYVLDEETLARLEGLLGSQILDPSGGLKVLGLPHRAGGWGDKTLHPLFTNEDIERSVTRSLKDSHEFRRRLSAVPRSLARKVPLPPELARIRGLLMQADSEQDACNTGSLRRATRA